MTTLEKPKSTGIFQDKQFSEIKASESVAEIKSLNNWREEAAYRVISNYSGTIWYMIYNLIQIKYNFVLRPIL